MDWEGLKLLIWINLLFAGEVDKHYWETGLTENRSSSGLPKMFTAIQLYVRWFKKVCQDDNGSIHNILKAMTFHLFVGPPQWPYLQWIKNVLYMLKNFMTNICCIRTLLALLCTLSTFWNSVPPFWSSLCVCMPMALPRWCQQVWKWRDTAPNIVLEATACVLVNLSLLARHNAFVSVESLLSQECIYKHNEKAVHNFCCTMK